MDQILGAGEITNPGMNQIQGAREVTNSGI